MIRWLINALNRRRSRQAPSRWVGGTAWRYGTGIAPAQKPAKPTEGLVGGLGGAERGTRPTGARWSGPPPVDLVYCGCDIRGSWYQVPAGYRPHERGAVPHCIYPPNPPLPQ